MGGKEKVSESVRVCQRVRERVYERERESGRVGEREIVRKSARDLSRGPGHTQPPWGCIHCDRVVVDRGLWLSDTDGGACSCGGGGSACSYGQCRPILEQPKCAFTRNLWPNAVSPVRLQGYLAHKKTPSHRTLRKPQNTSAPPSLSSLGNGHLSREREKNMKTLKRENCVGRV